jgi:hypothetical protein
MAGTHALYFRAGSAIRRRAQENVMATKIVVIQPHETNEDFEAAPRKFLAQGDSWFSIGALPPALTTNILSNLSFDQACGAITFASPGRTLQQMVDWRNQTPWLSVLCGGSARPWDALLFSAGGNDLFDAILTMPDEADASKAKLRLLRTVAERQGIPAAPDASHYVRPEAWSAFLDTMLGYIKSIIAKRDATGSKSIGVPIVFHSYDVAQPRNAPVLNGIGPWLYKAFTSAQYAVPPEDWQKLVRYLLTAWQQFFTGTPGDGNGNINDRLAAQHIVNSNIFFATLIGTLTPASAESTGEMGDWENEIHPSISGYERLGRVYAGAIPKGGATLLIADVGAQPTT